MSGLWRWWACYHSLRVPVYLVCIQWRDKPPGSGNRYTALANSSTEAFLGLKDQED